MNIKDNRAIAFIGVGQMGHGIVKNLLRGGHDVTVLEHPGNVPLDDLIEAGLKVGDSVQAMAAQAEVIFICVTGTPQVESVVLSQDGVLNGLRKGSIVVDCSTAVPQSTLKLAAAIAQKGGSLVDAPMTRTPKEAEQGRLNVMLGGEDGAIDAVINLIGAYAENIYRTGPVGSGHKMKLLHNFMALGNAVLAAEAVACAEKSGVNMDTFSEVIMSGGGDSTVFRRLLPYMLDNDDSSFRFSIANAHKDLGYYRAMANDLKAPKATAGVVHDVLGQAMEQGIGDRSMPNLIDFMKG